MSSQCWRSRPIGLVLTNFEGNLRGNAIKFVCWATQSKHHAEQWFVVERVYLAGPVLLSPANGVGSAMILYYKLHATDFRIQPAYSAIPHVHFFLPIAELGVFRKTLNKER